MAKSVTLILGGIGVKGVASIGILQSLQERNLKIKKIIAAGISSLVSAQFALGRDLNLKTGNSSLSSYPGTLGATA